jgi:hypothetical protein
MSYDIEMTNRDGTELYVDRFEDGGTYRVGGTDVAELNVTYNYVHHFREHLDAELGIRWLYGKTGAGTVERLEAAVAALGTDRDQDYWCATPGNAGAALARLLAWAKQYPEGVFDGD